MSLHGVLRASARIFFSLALLAAILPLTSGDAEARRRGGKTISAGTGVERNHHNVSEQASPGQHPADVDDATAGTENANQSQAPVQPVVRASAARVITKPKDIDVPGCSIGMICTVCIAGCNDGGNPIVHAVPKGH
ncbi:MAG: hypothetical protein AB7E81_18205 [Hyphomicrobiaceae bacterium]